MSGIFNVMLVLPPIPAVDAVLCTPAFVNAFDCRDSGINEVFGIRGVATSVPTNDTSCCVVGGNEP